MTREEAIDILRSYLMFDKSSMQIDMALNMAIEALSADTVSREHHDMEIKELKHQIKDQAEMVSVVRCKDCRHADECHKSVQYTRNEPRTVTMGYAPIDFCSHGERREE